MRVPSSAGDLLTLASSGCVVVTPARRLVPQPQKLGATRQACPDRHCCHHHHRKRQQLVMIDSSSWVRVYTNCCHELRH